MFGYKLIKTSKFEAIKIQLDEANNIVDAQATFIAELLDKIKELEAIITNLTDMANAKNENVAEEKPIKKVRRKTTKKDNKNEE